ncbi:hypothetical protein Acr_10g0003410 [Actinidia rufa]|uniref:Uncharacterized protein n=1 Tax=Actinidia rufa TaxID=165716 RepID=A0A7J0F963_9ERIC|nr:hypothetical protein Acr_10g0003410 [Actinidia rufa]
MENSSYSWFLFLKGLKSKEWIRIMCRVKRIGKNKLAVKITLFSRGVNGFWAAVNGLPCDTHLPDPDMYIDEIDWNPRLDPEMIMDLDREYFNPDDGRDNTMHNSVGRPLCRGKPAISSQNVGPAKEKGWGIAVGNSWGGDPRKTNVHESRNFNSVDAPCARTLHQGNGCGNDKGWGNCGDRNWGWKQSGNHNSEPKYLGF